LRADGNQPVTPSNSLSVIRVAARIMVWYRKRYLVASAPQRDKGEGKSVEESLEYFLFPETKSADPQTGARRL